MAKEYVTVEEFKKLEKSLGKILDVLEEKMTKKEDKAETEQDKKVIAAAPNKYTSNPEWEGVAAEILGEYLDHTEVEHEKTGGIKFTVVIKKEMSNASEEYLRQHGVDRRTKEVGALGMDGVVE